MMPPIDVDWSRLATVQQAFLQSMAELTRCGAKPADVHALNGKTLLALADAAVVDDKTRARLRFGVEQWVAAASPDNLLAFNAEALQKALDTGGESLGRGLSLLLEDLRRGRITQSDERAFQVGKNLACTEGAVVFENAFFQLIEYKPTTAKVHARPLLLVPPCINKFYILDLQADNSFVRHAVAQGHRTFLVSWRNPDASLAQATWDDYAEQGVITAIDTVMRITAAPKINLLGFCIGGTLLSTALAVMAARKRHPAASVTLLTTPLDFSDTGVLDIFVDEASVRLREAQLGAGGLLNGRELAATFNALRPNELLWNYVVDSYLKGQPPRAFDLLFWNADSTNLPGRFYTWFLRTAYLENRLATPGAATVCGVPVDLGKIRAPFYLYGSRDDHIVPIGETGGGAYASTQLLKGPCRFVMGASGHIAGVINPPAKNKRCFWTRDDTLLPATLPQWMEGAHEHAGSWWGDWHAWLASFAGPLVAAPQGYGGGGCAAIEAAPGRYVLA